MKFMFERKAEREVGKKLLFLLQARTQNPHTRIASKLKYAKSEKGFLCLYRNTSAIFFMKD